MRRLGVALFAFLLGLCGAVAVVYVIGAADEPRTVALLGEADIQGHCRRLHGERAMALLTRPTIDSWQCASRSNGIFDTAPVDFDALCTLQYDTPSFAVATDPAWPLSWDCFKAPGR